MTAPERRFTEAEVAAIIETATNWKDPRRQPVEPGDGLTLDQVQEIGREIGIAPNAITGAADAFKDSGTTLVRRFLGLPLRVERNVKLRRDFSEDEWEQVVADLREVFNSPGVVKEDGSLREWSSGNLQVVLEVNAVARVVRLRTFKGNALVLLGAGFGISGAAGGLLVAMLLKLTATDSRLASVLALMVAVGAIIAGATAISVGPWARRRREQMSEVAARVIALDRS